jgi:hypothetical protein
MRRGSAPGVDGLTWAGYRRGLRDRLAVLAEQLRAGDWTPDPLREVAITSFTGKVFTAAIPTVEDRIVHRAMRLALDPIRGVAGGSGDRGYVQMRHRWGGVGGGEDDRVQVQRLPVGGDGEDPRHVPGVGLDEQHVGREVLGVVGAGVQLVGRVDAHVVQ